MRRRDFIQGIVGSAAAWPIPARAQQPAMPVVGYLNAGTLDGMARETAGVRQGLSEAGYNEGQNILVESRWAGGHYERLSDLAADLARRNVSVIVAIPAPAALAAKAATTKIPIVFEVGIDPVASGVVASINKPGGNITGIVNLSSVLVAKRIEVMHEIVPDSKLIAVLLNPDNLVVSKAQIDDARAAQASLGIQVKFLQASTIGDIEAAFANAVELKAGAVVIGADPFFISKQNETAALAARYGIPAIEIQRGFVLAGGLISYGGDLVDACRLAGIYAGRILKGEKAADLPIQQSTKIQMAINLKAAKALGLTIPLPLLGRADEVIE